jgi:hypothetical protein
VKIGDTFIWSPIAGRTPHLYIIISNPSLHEGKCIAVNITTSVRGKYSFVLKPGEHPFICKESDVAFGDAERTTAAQIQSLIASGAAIPHSPMDLKVVQKIVDEAHTHAAFTPAYRRLLPPSTGK